MSSENDKTIRVAAVAVGLTLAAVGAVAFFLLLYIKSRMGF